MRARELALNGPGHAETLRVELRMAQVRAVQGDLAGALADLDRLHPVIEAVFGPDHRVTLTLLALRGDVLTRLELYDEAVAAEAELYRLTVAVDGPRSWTALGTLVAAAQAQCRAGHAEPGLAHAQAAYDGARAAFGEAHVLTQATAGMLAFCLVIDRQYHAAQTLLDHLDVRAVAEMTTDPSYGAEVDVMRADSALGVGDRATGRALLAKVAPIFEARNADRYMQRWERRLRQAP